MQYRPFGKLDWKVSALGFGAMRLPILDGKSGSIDQPKATEMIRHAIDNGLNYLDTAYVYHEQKSESAVGIALKDGYRERVKIATKLPIWLVKTTSDFDRMLNEQLERLQTDHIDFYLLHALNKDSWQKILDLKLIQEAEKALADGRIRHLGFSFHDKLETFKKIVDGYDKWTFCQIQYNFMDTEFQAGKEGLQYAASKGIAVVVMEPLRGGKLAADIPAARPLWESALIKRTPADWALQWLWNQPEVSVVLSGMSTLDQLKENLGSASNSSIGLLTAQELELVEQVNKVLTARSPIPCTACEYCLPCPNNVNIPRNFESYNNAAMYNDIADSRMDYKMWIPDDAKAAQCIQCDECLDKCPQQIAISTWMPVIDGVLGLGQPFVEKVS